MSDDTARIKSDFLALDARLRSRLNQAVEHAIEVGTDKARHDHRWVSRTGETEAAIVSNYSVTGDGAHGTILVESENALRLNDGTAPHEIRPKEGEGFKGPTRRGQSRRKKDDIGTHRVALRWVDGGTTHFAAVVHHPGTEADPFLDRAADAAFDALDAGIEAAIDDVFGGG